MLANDVNDSSDIMSQYLSSLLKLTVINHYLSLHCFLLNHILRRTNNASNLNFIYSYNKTSALTTEYMKYVKICIYTLGITRIVSGNCANINATFYSYNLLFMSFLCEFSKYISV